MTASDDEASVERCPPLSPEHAIEDTTTLAPIARTARNIDAETENMLFRPSIAKTGRCDRSNDEHSARAATHFFQAVTA
jgi:hypothetical protein